MDWIIARQTVQTNEYNIIGMKELRKERKMEIMNKEMNEKS